MNAAPKTQQPAWGSMHRQAVHCFSATSAEETAKKLINQASSSTLKQAAAAFWPDGAGVLQDAAAFAEST